MWWFLLHKDTPSYSREQIAALEIENEDAKGEITEMDLTEFSENENKRENLREFVLEFSGGFEDMVWATTADGAEECMERARIGREHPF
jgi:hypothetical protein